MASAEPTAWSQLRQIRRHVVEASDEQVRQLVAMVDSLSSRGEADALIAPLRPRLALLKPPRRLNLSRLMFMPLDPLIISPAAWRPGTVGISCAVLMPLVGVVEAALGQVATQISSMLAGQTTSNRALVTQVGENFWPLAATMLRRSTAPAHWTEASGHRLDTFAPLARSIADLLADGAALWALTSPAPGIDPEVAKPLLNRAAAAGSQQLAMMLALLLALVPQGTNFLQLADELAKTDIGSANAAPDRALEFLLSNITAFCSGPDHDTTMPSESRRAALLLNGLILQQGGNTRRAARLEPVRRQLDGTCRRGFEAAAAAIIPGTVADDAAVAHLEATAVDLRRFELAGRQIGGAAFYDQTLKQTADRLRRNTGLEVVDRRRLVEILLGPDAAADPAAIYLPVHRKAQ